MIFLDLDGYTYEFDEEPLNIGSNQNQVDEEAVYNFGLFPIFSFQKLIWIFLYDIYL